MSFKNRIIALTLAISALLIANSFTFLKSQVRRSMDDDNPKIKKMRLTEGFKAEHLYSPSEEEQGSWVAMTFDDKGRMITSDQYGSLYRLQIPPIGSASSTPKVEKIKVGNEDEVGMGYANGLLYAFNSLYVMINNGTNNKDFPRSSGLYRLQDTDNDDHFDKVTLLKELVGQGEHGPHSIVLSPDGKSLYVIAGNHTDVPAMDAYRLPSNWQEENLFPLIVDPRGHANSRMAPGGWVANVDPEGKNWELISAGYRNAFDLAFNEVGDLFVYDADMEWDFGQPWYRPTRINHATSASEYGWRTGNSKWSPSFPDNLPAVLNIGQGSPTNLLHLKDAKFPAKYRSSLLAFDWSFGIIHAIHLKPDGSSYKADREEFLSGIPLPLTDGAIGPDGALYFLTGGRRLESDLYRVTYVGNESTAPVAAKPINDENQLRRDLEKFHTGGPKKNAVITAWPQLSNPDRFIRYAARLALEHQPVAEWQSKALSEKNPVALTQSLISLIRMGDGSKKNEIISALSSINYKSLNEGQQLDILRAFELSFLRMGEPEGDNKTKVVVLLSPNYPAKTAQLNRSLSKVLLYLDAPGAVQKTLALMKIKTEPGTESLMEETATASSDLILRNPQYGADIAKMLANMPPMQHTYYAVVLSMAKNGWTPKMRETYFKWFDKALSFEGGRSYIGFIDRARKLALKNVPEDKLAFYDKMSGADKLTSNGNDLTNINFPKGPGRRWNIESAEKAIEGGLTNRNFEKGKSMFAATTCKSCHTMRGDGGIIGPDLTQLGTRFSTKDMLESIIEPDKVVSDQYAATQFGLKDGNSLVGRLVNEDETTYYVSQNPFAPESIEKVLKSNVVSVNLAQSSIMFPGLINSLNEEELKDLVAYLMAGGNEKSQMFSTK
jgi:putative heme-binding domain-containing protein